MKEELQEEKDRVSFLDILLVIVRKWKLIIISTFIAGILIVGYSEYTKRAPVDAENNKLPEIYAARVQVKLDTGSSTSAAVLSASGLAKVLTGTSLSGNVEVNFVIKLLQGRTLAENVLKALKEDGTWEREITIWDIMRNIRPVYNIEVPGIIDIQYLDTDIGFAVYMADLIVTELEKRYNQFSMEKSVYKRQFLEERLVQIENDLKEAKAKLNTFKQESAIIGVESGETASGIFVQELLFSRYIPKEERYEIETQYEELNSEVNHYQTLYDRMMEQYEAAKIEEMDRSKHFQIIEPAVPFGRIGPNRKQMIVVIVGATLLISIVIAFFSSYVERVRRDSEESEKAKEIREAFFGPPREKKKSKNRDME